jgi:hypothetical protein
MAKSLRKTALKAKLRRPSGSKNCYPCHWAKLLPMSPAGQGERAGSAYEKNSAPYPAAAASGSMQAGVSLRALLTAGLTR